MTNIICIDRVRKPSNLKEVIGILKNGECDPVFQDIEKNVPAAIDETIHLSYYEYVKFTSDFYKDRDWLAGKGGWQTDNGETNGKFLHYCVIEVTADGCETLYIDPSGHDYARYVCVKTGSMPQMPQLPRKQQQNKAENQEAETEWKWNKAKTKQILHCSW